MKPNQKKETERWFMQAERDFDDAKFNSSGKRCIFRSNNKERNLGPVFSKTERTGFSIFGGQDELL